jgi:hypothetical protein
MRMKPKTMHRRRNGLHHKLAVLALVRFLSLVCPLSRPQATTAHTAPDNPDSPCKHKQQRWPNNAAAVVVASWSVCTLHPRFCNGFKDKMLH